jgi:hypothetical protein
MADANTDDVEDAAADDETGNSRGGPGTRSATTYPYYDLEEAEKFARGIASTGGTEATVEEVLKAIGLTSTVARAWSYRLSSAREFGLVTRGGRNEGKLYLTDLGRDLVSPESAQARKAALINAFLTPKLYKKLFEQYKGMPIPESTYVQNALKTKHGLLETVLETAADAFIKSAKYAGAVGADKRLTGAGASAAAAEPPSAEPKPPAATNQGQQVDVPSDFILHQFQLRKDLKLTVPLPPDLTQSDVQRLNRWMKTLPLEEPADEEKSFQ